MTMAIVIAAAGPMMRVAAAADDGADHKVPRFACLKFQETPLRDGPKSSDTVILIFKRQHLPLEIVREFGTWRYIRDPDGAEGWLEDVKLETRDRFVMVRGGIRNLRAGPSSEAAIVARLEPDVLARLDHCGDDQPRWCQVRVGDMRGWIDRSEVWGVYPNETYPVL